MKRMRLIFFFPLMVGFSMTHAGERWLTVDAEIWRQALTTFAHKGEFDWVERKGEPAVVARVPENFITRLAVFVHQRFGRCGGFMVHGSRQEARSALDAFTKPNRAKAQVDYTLDNAAVVAALQAPLTEDGILETLGPLSEFHNRFFQSQAGIDSAHWLYRHWLQISSARDDVSVELIEHEDHGQPSVVLTIQGSQKPDEVVVLGGHLDSITTEVSALAAAPGADDNASGLATLTEVLRAMMLTNYRPERTLQIMGYAAEEVGLRGSGDIAQSYANRGVNVVGVLQLDMTNFHGSDEEIVVIQDYTNPAQNAFVVDLIETYLDVSWGAGACGYACSDHASWSRFGFPASFPFEAKPGEHNPFIHTGNDRLAASENRAVHALKFAKLVAAYVAELAKGSHDLKETVAVERRLPHVTGPDGGFTSLVLATNPSETEKSLNLFPFDGAGDQGPGTEIVLLGGETRGFTMDDLFANHPSHVGISGDGGAVVSIAYQADQPGSSPAHVLESAVTAMAWRLFPGNWDAVWDGFAVVNTGAAPTSVTVQQISSEGSELANALVSESLSPNGKALFVLGTAFESLEGGHYRISAAQPLAVTALRGNLASDFLWENAAIPETDEPKSETVTYQVTFQSNWSAATHPQGFPPNPHFSGLIGATHRAGTVFWEEGQIASAGIESMAETGSKSPLTSEIQAAINGGDAGVVLSGAGIANSPGAVIMNFDISREFPLVTLVSMLAPSPDWFVGVSGLRLFEDGVWVTQKVVPLYPFDAGSDSGTDYTSANADTNPQEPVYRIPTPPFLIEGKVPPLGTFTFTRQ